MAKKVKDSKSEKIKKKAASKEAKGKKSSKGDDDESPKKKGKKDKFTGFDPSVLYTDSIDEISQRQGVDSDLMDNVQPMSTGNLALDLLWNGGIRPGWYTNAGPEQSCKTTGCFQIMTAAIKAGVPLISLFDYEGSSAVSKPYISNILRTNGLKISAKDVFGRKDKETGKWRVKPLIRYTAETIGEKFFNWLSEILRNLPDKKFIADKWWFVFEDNKVNKAKYGEYANQSMPKKYGKGIWVEAPDGNLQAVIFTDSLPAMNPLSNDEEEQDKSIALQARMFSKHLPRVKGRLASKMVAVVAVNQLRDAPMVMYGPKQQEPGGQALKFNSDSRFWWNSRTSGMPFNPKIDSEEKLEKERSVEGSRKDRYRYIEVTSKKNKLGGGAGRKLWIRLWVSDCNGDARGFDPVFDTIQFLKATGQLSGKRKKFFLKLHNIETKKSIDWETLKLWVLGTKDDKVRICKALGIKPMDLRKFCFSQVESGLADRLFSNARDDGKDDDEGGDDDE